MTFPADKNGVFCIGSADGTGMRSNFSLPFDYFEMYSTVGEGVVAPFTTFITADRIETNNRKRMDGTSTATPVAAGVTALLLDYMRMNRFPPECETYENVRKIFIIMSQSEIMIDKHHRFLMPWTLFDDVDDIVQLLHNVFARGKFLWSGTDGVVRN